MTIRSNDHDKSNNHLHGRLDEAFAAVASAIRGHQGSSVPEEVTSSLELLRASLERWHSEAARGEIYAPRHGAWIVTPLGTHIDLSRRRPLRRLTAALIEARLTRPGRALSSAELIAAGWPEEPNEGDASSNRLRVGICRLRQLGLDGVILTTASGWLLNPSIPLVQEDPIVITPSGQVETVRSVAA